jgi:hypothetical protein
VADSSVRPKNDVLERSYAAIPAVVMLKVTRVEGAAAGGRQEESAGGVAAGLRTVTSAPSAVTAMVKMPMQSARVLSARVFRWPAVSVSRACQGSSSYPVSRWVMRSVHISLEHIDRPVVNVQHNGRGEAPRLGRQALLECLRVSEPDRLKAASRVESQDNRATAGQQ